MTPPAGRLPPRGNSNVSSTGSQTSTFTVPRATDNTTTPIMPLTIDTINTTANTTPNNNNTDEFLVLEKPIPMPLKEARDVSSSSREGLKRHILERRTSLTLSEQAFLDSLVVHGNEIEVQLAMEKLQDEDLFFDYETPRHLKYHPDTDTSNSDDEDDIKVPRPGLLDRQFSTGSQRRLQVLEQRRQESRATSQMWKAHENGIAVTPAGSKISLMLRRDSSFGSSTSMRRAATDAIFRERSNSRPKK